MQAVGMIEIQGVAAAMDALDIMEKTAAVQFLTWERKMGGRLVTLIVQGEVAAVTEAVENAVARAIKKPCAHLVLPNPHEETMKIIRLSASRKRGE